MLRTKIAAVPGEAAGTRFAIQRALAIGTREMLAPPRHVPMIVVYIVTDDNESTPVAEIDTFLILRECTITDWP